MNDKLATVEYELTNYVCDEGDELDFSTQGFVTRWSDDVTWEIDELVAEVYADLPDDEYQDKLEAARQLYYYA